MYYFLLWYTISRQHYLFHFVSICAGLSFIAVDSDSRCDWPMQLSVNVSAEGAGHSSLLSNAFFLFSWGAEKHSLTITLGQLVCGLMIHSRSMVVLQIPPHSLFAPMERWCMLSWWWRQGGAVMARRKSSARMLFSVSLCVILINVLHRAQNYSPTIGLRVVLRFYIKLYHCYDDIMIILPYYSLKYHSSAMIWM